MKIRMVAFDQENNQFMENKLGINKRKKQIKSHFKAVVFYCANNHMYIINNKATIMGVCRANSQKNVSAAVFEDHVKPTHNFIDFVSLEHAMEQEKGTVCIREFLNEAPDVTDLFHELAFVHQTIAKPMSMTTMTKMKAFKLPNGVFVAASANQGLNMTWRECRKLCKIAGCTFTNQSIGYLISKIKDNVFQPHRKEFSKQERAAIHKKAGGKCANCAASAAKFHVDHVVPLASGGSNDDKNLQILCIPCHATKSAREVDNGSYCVDPMQSRFSVQGKKVVDSLHFKRLAFIDSFKESKTKMKACAATALQEGAKTFAWSFIKEPTAPVSTEKDPVVDASLDMIKCRRNIAMYSKFDFPCYSVLDNITVYKGSSIKCGNYYIETKNYFPCRGNGWYSQPMVQYLLDTAIISKADIKLQYLSALTVPARRMKVLCKTLIQSFGEVGHAKLGVNAFIGLAGRNGATFYKTHFTSSPQDAFNIMKNHEKSMWTKNEENGVSLYSVSYDVKVAKTDYGLPLYSQVLDVEAIQLHKMVSQIRSDGGVIHYYNTDGISFRMNKSKLPNIDSILHAKGVPVWRYEKKFCTSIARGVMQNWKRTDKYAFQPLSWTVIKDPLNNDFDSFADTVLARNTSLFLTGAPGCGKTHLSRTIINKLEAAGKTVVKLGTTNVAKNLLSKTGAQTCHRFVKRCMRSKKICKAILDNTDVILVDEVSMCHEYFFHCFNVMKTMKPSLMFIFSGDYNQLLPVCDRSTEFDYSGSDILKFLSDGLQVALTVCRRSDDRLFNLYQDVDSVTETTLPMKAMTMRNLCYTNNYRKKLNQALMEKFLDDQKKIQKRKTIQHVCLEQLLSDSNSQDVKIAKGMPVIAKSNHKYQVKDKAYEIVNNWRYTVTKVYADRFKMEDADGDVIEVEHDMFQRYFRVAFAVTIHCSQGQTISGKYTIHEWEKMDTRLKYVALSRGTDCDNVQIKNTSNIQL